MKYLVILLLLLSQVASSQPGIIFHDACETDPKFGSGQPYPNNFWNWRHGDPAKSTVAVSDSFSRAGNYSYRFNINRDTLSHLSDRWRENYLVYNFIPAGSNATFSNAVGQPEATNKAPINLRWNAMSTLLPEWYQVEPEREILGFLLFTIPESNGAAQYLEISNGRYIFHSQLWNNENPTENVTDLGPVQKGVWEDWILERNYTNQDSGFIRFYRNGSLVVNLSGGNWPPANQGFAKEPYVIHGMLELGWGKALNNTSTGYSRAIYYDEFKYGDHTASLANFLFFKKQPEYIFYDNVEVSGMPFPKYSLPVTEVERWNWYVGDSSTSKVAPTTEYSRTGKYAYKFELSKGIQSTYQFLKSELVWNFLPAGSPLGTLGSTEAYYRQPLKLKWMAFSTLIPSYNLDYNTITSIGLNTKSVTDDWPTPAYLAMEKNRYQIHITKVKKNGTGGYSYEQTYQDIGEVVRDKWEDWIMERNWTSDSTAGFVRLYRNKTLVYEYIGGNWVDDDKHSKEPYMQMGLYKWAFAHDWLDPVPDVNNVTMFMDEIKFGNDQMILEDFYVNEKPNLPPAVNAGEDIMLYLPATRTQLSGTVEDKDGAIFSKAWRKISGPPGGNISDTLSDKPIITNLQAGVYIYHLVAKDNSNKETIDEIIIQVMNPVVQMVAFDSFNGGAAQALPFIWRGGTVSNAVSVASKQPVSGDFALQMTVGPASGGAYLAIDQDATLRHIYFPEQIWMAVALGRIYVGDYNAGGMYNLLNYTVSTGDFIRILRTSNSYKAQYSKDNGATWVDVYTYQFKSSTTVYIKATYDFSGAFIYYPAIYSGTGIPGTASPSTAPAENVAVEAQEEVTTQRLTRISPNPARNWFNVIPGEELNTGRLDIRIYDSFGKLYKKDQLAHTGNRREYRLSADHLPNGNYFVLIQDEKGKQVQRKLIIQH